jgi:hypothetical protein
LRKVEIKGYVIFDENELSHGDDIASKIEDMLFNVDGVAEWSIEETSNEEIEYERDENDFEQEAEDHHL